MKTNHPSPKSISEKCAYCELLIEGRVKYILHLKLVHKVNEIPSLSLCSSCNCMTKTIDNKCGKCKFAKDIDVPTNQSGMEWVKEFEDRFVPNREGETANNIREYMADIKSFISQVVIPEAKASLIEEWDKAISILYCEHCGKLMSQDRVTNLGDLRNE